jgi:hypothetical protein
VAQRVEGDFDAAEARQALVARPDVLAAANRDGQDWRARFEGEPNRARLEARQLAVGVCALPFGEDHHRAAAAQPL